ncbi:hypothetical protein [Solobacterium moorei]|uniref:PTS sugar transporter subunit IIA n=1 Tax=Solobacterium moorei TaxID=102148 RepID=UPI0028ECB1BA|nr:hypothetical protein [Solobacterium moorei]
MKFGIIISGHGNFATGISSSLNLIMGLPENLAIIDFPDGDDILHLENQFDNAINKFTNMDIIVLVDLFSGSPFNIGMKKAMNNHRIHLYYGANLGMILELISRSNFVNTIDELTDEIVEVGKNQIGEFKSTDLSLRTDDEEDDDL